MKAHKKRLGRGLDSLLSSTRLEQLESVTDRAHLGRPDVPVSVSGINEIDVELIRRNPHQPRQKWDEGALYELAESIKSNGLVQPILVRPMGQGYQLIAGERRLRAAKLAGMAQIPTIVRVATEEQMLEWALVENIHRSDLNALERARAYEHYIRTFSLTQEQAAGRLGEDRSTVANYVRLLELSGEVREMLADGRISMGHARALLAVGSGVRRDELAQMTMAKRLSVRDLEKIIRQKQTQGDEPVGQAPAKSGHIVELEDELRGALGTKVTIKTVGRREQRGRIIIEFYSLDDFDRIRGRLA